MSPDKRTSMSTLAPERHYRSGSETRARSQVIQVRVTPDEYARYAAFAAAQGVKSVPDLLRLAVESAIWQEVVFRG